MEEQYLTVKEFAQRAGISKQAIYKQAKNPKSRIYPYIKFLPKGTYISTKALIDLYDKPFNEEQSTVDKSKQQKTIADEEIDNQKHIKTPTVDTFGYNVYNDFINHLQNEIKQEQSKYNQLSTQIDRLNSIIQEKDRIIAEQAGQLSSLNQSMIELSNKALTTATNQQTLAAMEKTAEPPQIAETTEHSRSFLQRLFKK